mmetsp:Transcript_26418/g.60359  ORF Transcript_26418/g.60359 Transcript_26418/m.60359 type:complete len:714 (+) Transcript_26418:147-2288(+)
MPKSRKNPTSGWKPATTRPSNEATRATLKARAVAATARRLPTLQGEVEASRKKYDWGGPNSYPWRRDDSQSTGRSHPILEPGRRISRAAATRLGDARGETHDAATLKARTFTSLQKKDLRRARGDKSHLKRGRAFNPARVPRANSPPGHASPSGVSSTLSPAPAYDVADFLPDCIEIGPDGNITVIGKISIPPDQLVTFLKTPHHPLVYSRRLRDDPVPGGASRDYESSVPMEAEESTESMVEAAPPRTAEPTPAVGPTAPLPMAESTPVAEPALMAPSSVAEPTSTAEPRMAARPSYASSQPCTTRPTSDPSGTVSIHEVDGALPSKGEAGTLPSGDSTGLVSTISPAEERRQQYLLDLAWASLGGDYWESLDDDFDIDSTLALARTPPSETMVPSSMAEPTPVAESAPAASSSVVDPMPVTESAAEATSSLAEPTPSHTEPVVWPEDVATTPVEGPARVPEGGNNRPPPEEAYLGSDRDGTALRSLTDEAARPSVIPVRVPPGFAALSSTGDEADPVGTGDSAAVVPSLTAEPMLGAAIPFTGEAARPSVIPSRPGVIQLTGDSAGLVRTIEADDDDDWVIVEPKRAIPALPTTSRGGIDFTRLDLAHVELVPYLCADLWSWDYGDDDALITASEDARRSLLTKYLDRQLQADRILTISNYDFGAMQECSDLAPIYMTEDEDKSARARGLSRKWDWDHDEEKFFLRDKTSL